MNDGVNYRGSSSLKISNDIYYKAIKLVLLWTS